MYPVLSIDRIKMDKKMTHYFDNKAKSKRQDDSDLLSVKKFKSEQTTDPYRMNQCTLPERETSVNSITKNSSFSQPIQKLPKNNDLSTSSLDLEIEFNSTSELEDEITYNQTNFNESFKNNVDNLKQESLNDECLLNDDHQTERLVENEIGFNRKSESQHDKLSEIEIIYDDSSDDLMDTELEHEERDTKSTPIVLSQNSDNTSKRSLILSPDEQHLSLDGLDLPESVLSYYSTKSISCLMQWQYEALHRPGVLVGTSNLIFSAPTSAGKTIIADIMMIRTVINRHKKALYVLPYISLANEKVVALESMLKYTSIQVGGFMGNTLPSGRFPAVNIAVCTIEKANNIVNRLIEDNKLDELGIVIVDELHELGASDRGSILEQMLVKLKFAKNHLGSDIQIVGMSATLPNLKEMSEWLEAESYSTVDRPIPLKEMYLVGENIFDASTNEIFRNVVHGPDPILIKNAKFNQPNYLLPLALETINSNNGVLIFCSSKKQTENLAKKLSEFIQSLVDFDVVNPPEQMRKSLEEHRFQEVIAGISYAQEQLKNNLKEHFLKEVIEQLKKCPAKLDELLAETIPFAVAYHHAGLSLDERDIIESGFKDGTIKAIFATPTLSSGVNLPARRVIIETAKVGRDNLSSLTYKQMTGRAGRKGIDKLGESIIIAKPNDEIDLKLILKLVSSDLEPIRSKAIELDPNQNIIISENFRRMTLESIATGMLKTFDEIKKFLNCTLFAHQKRPLTDDEIKKILEQLSTREGTIQKIVDNNKIEHFVPSKLGQGILASSFSPDEAFRLKKELSIAMNALSLNCDLHLLYHVIPNANVKDRFNKINWRIYLNILSGFDREGELSPRHNVMKLLNIRVAFVMDQVNFKPRKETEEHIKYLKFFYAIALNEIMNERPLKEVAIQYEIDRGDLQALQVRSSSYCGMLSIFCKKLGWETLSVVIKMFQDRLYFGINQELIELMNISCLNAQMARCLFEGDFKDVKTIAHSNQLEIEKLFINHVAEDKDMKIHWVSTKCKSMSNSEISELIIKEARAVIEEQAGGKLKWDDDDADVSIGIRSADATSSEFSQNSVNNDKTRMRAKYIKDNLSQHRALHQTTFVESTSNNESSGESSPYSTPTSPEKIFTSTKKIGKKSKDFKSYYKSPRRKSISPIKKVRQSYEKQMANYTSEMSEKSIVFSNDSSLSSSVQQQQQQQQEDNSVNNSNVTDRFEIEIDEDQLDSAVLTHIGSQQLSSFTDAETPETNSFKILTQSPEDDSRRHNMDVELFESEEEDEENKTMDEVDSIMSSGSVVNVKSTIRKLENKLFYESNCNQKIDEKCFQLVDNEAFDICKKIEENDKLRYIVDEITQEKITSFIRTLQSASMFVIHFKINSMIVVEKDFLTCKPRHARDIRVQQEWLDKIEMICFMFGNRKIHCFNSNRMIRLLKDQMLKSEFEFREKLLACICYDAKVGYKILKCCFEMSDDNLKKIYWHDPKIAHWLLNTDADEPDSFLDFAPKYIDVTENAKIRFFNRLNNHIKSYKKEIIENENNQKAKPKDIEMISTTLLIYPVMSKLKHELKRKMLYQSYINIELPVLLIFAKMELSGFILDKNYMRESCNQWIQLNNSLEKLIHDRLVKEKIKTSNDKKKLNVRAPKEVKFVFQKLGFYEKLQEIVKLPIKVVKSLGTSKEILDKMRSFDELPGYISDSRKLYHLIDSHQNLKEEMTRLNIDNKVMGTFKHFMATGRIAMVLPNLLGIDKDSEMEINGEQYKLSLKRAFTAKPGYALITADYCQLELRILAALSKEENLIKAFELGKDPFLMIASRIKGKKADEITPFERNSAKQIVYAIIYGLGIKKLAENLDVDNEEVARDFVNEFHDAFPNLETFVQTSKDNATEKGYIETLFGRRRYLPNIQLSDRIKDEREKKRSDERKALNSRIQGSASDLVKLTMLKLDQAFEKTRIDAEILLQIHDELIFQVRNDEQILNDFFRILISEMSSCGSVIKTKLTIKVRKGFNWSEMEEIDIKKFESN